MTSSTPKKNILLVDDDLDFRETLADHFGRLGWHVILAADAQEAVMALQNNVVLAVVSDFLMPKVQGLQSGTCVELLASIQALKIKSPERCPRVVCLLTGYGNMVPPGYNHVANAIFTKPMSLKLLSEYIEAELATPRKS